MSDVHDMSDRELDMAVAEEVMGLKAAGKFRCFEDEAGKWMFAPAYTTDVTQTERVMERMAGDDRYYFILRREDVDSYWASFRISGWFYGWSECSNWKRAVCEAALLAVRGAA